MWPMTEFPLKRLKTGEAMVTVLFGPNASAADEMVAKQVKSKVHEGLCKYVVHKFR